MCVTCDSAVQECLASAHKYASNTDQSWWISQPGAKSISLTFSPDTETEEGYDYLYIYDAAGDLFGTYTGTELAGKQITVPGDFVEIQLVSDESMNYYGFAVTDVTVDNGVRGDIDGDGVADAYDVTSVFRYVNGLKTLSAEQAATADLNSDGKVNLFDAARLFYMVNGLI